MSNINIWYLFMPALCLLQGAAMVCRSMHLMGSDFTSPVQFDLTVGKVWQWQVFVLWSRPCFAASHFHWWPQRMDWGFYHAGPRQSLNLWVCRVISKRERHKRSFHLRYRLCLVALSCHTISIHSSGHCTYLTAWPCFILGAVTPIFRAVHLW